MSNYIQGKYFIPLLPLAILIYNIASDNQNVLSNIIGTILIYFIIFATLELGAKQDKCKVTQDTHKKIAGYSALLIVPLFLYLIVFILSLLRFPITKLATKFIVGFYGIVGICICVIYMMAMMQKVIPSSVC